MGAINIISHKVNESFVEQRQSDGYVNATALTKAYKLATGKRRDVSEWLSNKRTKETLNHLSSKTGIPVINLYQAFQGSSETGGGTWIHPKLAIRFGIWLSDEFGYLVEEWVSEWLVNGQSQALNKRVEEVENKLEAALSAITSLSSANAQLQSQVQNLLAASTHNPYKKLNYIPPGWNKEVWKQLPPQDKRHFRFLYNHHNFIPNYQTEDESVSIKTFTLQVRQKQKDELKTVVGEVSPEEVARLETAKKEALKRFWKGSEIND